jgi:hypothetical protein
MEDHLPRGRYGYCRMVEALIAAVCCEVESMPLRRCPKDLQTRVCAPECTKVHPGAHVQLSCTFVYIMAAKCLGDVYGRCVTEVLGYWRY